MTFVFGGIVVALWVPREAASSWLVTTAVAVASAVLLWMSYWHSRNASGKSGTGSALFPVLVGLLTSVIAYTQIYWAHSASSSCFGGDALSRPAAVYFTLTTMTTTGYGDITPDSDECRMLVSTQMVVNLTVVAALLRHVGTVTSQRPEDHAGGTEPVVAGDGTFGDRVKKGQGSVGWNVGDAKPTHSGGDGPAGEQGVDTDVGEAEPLQAEQDLPASEYGDGADVGNTEPSHPEEHRPPGK